MEYRKKLGSYDFPDQFLEIELEDLRPDRRDMCLYDSAYDAVAQRQDVDYALACARRYFAGEQSVEPVWELLSAAPAQAARDISHELRGEG